MAKLLSVTPRTIQKWLSRIDKDTKEQQKKTIFDLWLACYTQEEIADRVGCERPFVDHYLRQKENFPIGAKFKFQDDSFNPPIYNVWKLQKKTSGILGNIENFPKSPKFQLKT